MKKFDPRIEVGPFMGKTAVFAETSVENTRKIQNLTSDLRELGEFTREYEDKIQDVIDDDRLKDETKRKRIKKLNDDLEEKSEGYRNDIVEYRKQICEVMFDEWKSEPPEEEWFESDNFDDYMLFRIVDFFLNPVNPTLAEKE